MSSLIRWPFRFLDGLPEKQRGFQCLNQGASALNVCSQVTNGDLVSNGLSVFQYDALGTQSYANVNVTQGGSFFKINEGGMCNVGHGQAGILYQGLGVCHSNLPDLSFNQRFRRACRAFVNAWRAE